MSERVRTKTDIGIRFEVEQWKHGRVHFVHSVEFDVFGYGSKAQEAEHSFRIALKAILNHTMSREQRRGKSKKP